MNLDEAIQHYKDVAKDQRRLAELCKNNKPYEDGCSIFTNGAEKNEQIAEWLKELKAYREQDDDEELDFVPEHKKIPCTLIIGKPCGDAISRQAVDDAIYEYSRSCDVNYGQIMEYIDKVPSVSPQQKMGRWIKQKYGWNYQCSGCDFVIPPNAKEIFTFCPNCGAKMGVEE